MKIALLTCKKLPDLLPSDQKLIPLLAKYNIDAKAIIWDDKNVNWKEYEYLIFRNTWDYYEKETEFNIWLKKIEDLGVKTLNSLEIINQNKHKFYLNNLQKKGIKIIPTIFVNKTNLLNLKDLIPENWKKVVIKPAFSAGSYQTEVFEITDNFTLIEEINSKFSKIAKTKDLLLQEFMPEILSLGETSFIFFNKKFSHCILKKPVQGDFRVQVQYGGKYQLVHPSEEIINQAQKVIDTFADQLLYARVDGIVIHNELNLMEVECIEPDLYFDLAENSRQKFVDSIIEIINN